MKSCEVGILDVRTNELAFVVKLYGVSAREMMCVPPPVSVKDRLEKRGIDTTYLVSSPFLVRPIPRKFK
jgi:hypothetical protein